MARFLLSLICGLFDNLPTVAIVRHVQAARTRANDAQSSQNQRVCFIYVCDQQGLAYILMVLLLCVAVTHHRFIPQAAGCIIGKDYPHPIVDHGPTSKANMAKMKAAFDASKAAAGAAKGKNKSSNKDSSGSASKKARTK